MAWFAGARVWKDGATFRFLCWLDRLVNRKQRRLAIARCRIFPSSGSIAEETLYLTEIRRLKKWASFRCPGGCGKIVRLKLSGKETPQWSVRIDVLGRATLYPSVRQLTACRCHFWVKKGRVDWVSRPRPTGIEIERRFRKHQGATL